MLSHRCWFFYSCGCKIMQVEQIWHMVLIWKQGAGLRPAIGNTTHRGLLHIMFPVEATFSSAPSPGGINTFTDPIHTHSLIKCPSKGKHRPPSRPRSLFRPHTTEKPWMFIWLNNGSLVVSRRGLYVLCGWITTAVDAVDVFLTWLGSTRVKRIRMSLRVPLALCSVWLRCTWRRRWRRWQRRCSLHTIST